MRLNSIRLLPRALAGIPAGKTSALTVPVRMLRDYLHDSDDFCVLKADVEALSTLFAAAPTRRPDHILLEVSHADDWNRDLLSDLRQIGYRDVAEMNGNLLLKLA